MIVSAEIDGYLGLVCHRLGKLLGSTLEGVYAVGSLALGDSIIGRSDIDLVAVTSHSQQTRSSKR